MKLVIPARKITVQKQNSIYLFTAIIRVEIQDARNQPLNGDVIVAQSIHYTFICEATGVSSPASMVWTQEHNGSGTLINDDNGDPRYSNGVLTGQVSF